MSKHHNIQRIVRWCKTHRDRNFHYHDVGISSRTLGALCDTTFRGQIWLVRKGNALTRDSNNGLVMYGLASWVDIDNLHERYTI